MTKPRVSGYAIAQRKTTAALRDLVSSNGKEEYQLQCDVVKLLRCLALPGVVFFHVENERKRTYRQAASFKAMGGMAGVSDLIISLPNGKMAFLELKSRRGRLSDEQKAFLEGMDSHGHMTWVARTLDEATRFLADAGAIKAVKVTA